MYYDKHGMRMTRMKLDGETGSPFMVPHQRNPSIRRRYNPIRSFHGCSTKYRSKNLF